MAATIPTFANEAEELSKRFISRFYSHDVQQSLAFCDPDITYLGSTRDGVAFGIEELRRVMTTVLARYNPSLPISIEATSTELLEGRAVLVIVEYYLLFEPSAGYIRSGNKRTTMLWIMGDLGLRLRHVQVTAPTNPITTGYVTGAEYSVDASQEARAVIEQMSLGAKVALRTTDGVTHYLFPRVVRSIEAHRQVTVIHCLEGDLAIRRGFRQTVEDFGDALVVVHRGHAVNPQHVNSVDRTHVTLDDGSVVPLPQRRAHEVRQMLEKAILDLSTERTILGSLANLA